MVYRDVATLRLHSGEECVAGDEERILETQQQAAKDGVSMGTGRSIR